MRILFLSDNYPPEMNANARIVKELADVWANKNKQVVTVLTSYPNFPTGKIFSGYQNKWCTYEQDGKINVIRVKTYMAPNKGVVKRILDFLSFMVSSFFCGLFKKCDIVISITPQFFCALSGSLLAIFKRKPHVLILCDLWPDSIVSVGAMRPSLAIRLVKQLELWLYRHSDLIFVLSPYFKSYLEQQKIASDKIVISLSGVNHKEFYYRPKDQQLITRYALQKKFVVAYIGTMGMAHNHEEIIAIAKQFHEENYTDIVFMLIGDGAKKEVLQKQIQDQNLSNVIIDGPFPSAQIPDFWSIADVALVILRNVESNKTVIPSKMLEAMAMGKPIVLYAPKGEAMQLLYRAQAGFFIECGQQKELQETIRSCYSSPAILKTMSKNALEFAQKYTRKAQAEYMLSSFEKLLMRYRMP